MKKNIQPKYYPDAIVSCSCSNTFAVGSTQPQLRVEICSKCHPFYTGQEKYVDVMGRVDKFKKKRQKAEKLKNQIIQKKQKEEMKKQKSEKEPKTLREMLKAIQ